MPGTSGYPPNYAAAPQVKPSFGDQLKGVLYGMIPFYKQYELLKRASNPQQPLPDPNAQQGTPQANSLLGIMIANAPKLGRLIHK